MRISIGSDHRGFRAKEKLVQWLRAAGHEVIDEGTHAAESTDYPDFAARVAGKVARGEVDRGVLICATGVGMSIVANKFPGVRAANCCDQRMAELSRRHNDANVLCLSEEVAQRDDATALVEAWLKAEFEGGRHARRLAKIAELEKQLKQSNSTPSASH